MVNYLPKIIMASMRQNGGSSSGVSALRARATKQLFDYAQKEWAREGADGKWQPILSPVLGFLKGAVEVEVPLSYCRLLLALGKFPTAARTYLCMTS